MACLRGVARGAAQLDVAASCGLTRECAGGGGGVVLLLLVPPLPQVPPVRLRRDGGHPAGARVASAQACCPSASRYPEAWHSCAASALASLPRASTGSANSVAHQLDPKPPLLGQHVGRPRHLRRLRLLPRLPAVLRRLPAGALASVAPPTFLTPHPSALTPPPILGPAGLRGQQAQLLGLPAALQRVAPPGRQLLWLPRRQLAHPDGPHSRGVRAGHPQRAHTRPHPPPRAPP